MLWNGASGNNWTSLLLSGLNQTAAVDVLFVPVVSSDDPRAAGVPHTQHDNSLLSCISSGRLCVQPDGSFPAPGLCVCVLPLSSVHILHLCWITRESQVELKCVCALFFLLQSRWWALPLRWSQSVWCVLLICVCLEKAGWKWSALNSTGQQTSASPTALNERTHLTKTKINHAKKEKSCTGTDISVLLFELF